MSSRSQFRSADGCCICGTKSSSSRFSNSTRFSQYFSKCFGPKGEGRSGDICNACVLYVKRWCKAADQTTGKYEKVLDKKKGPGLKHITQIVKMQQRKQARLKAFGQTSVASHGMETRSKNQRIDSMGCCGNNNCSSDSSCHSCASSDDHYHHHHHHYHHYHHHHHLLPSDYNGINNINDLGVGLDGISVNASDGMVNGGSNMNGAIGDGNNGLIGSSGLCVANNLALNTSGGSSIGHSGVHLHNSNAPHSSLDALSQDSMDADVFRVPDSSCRATTRNKAARFTPNTSTRTTNYKKRVQMAPVKLPNADEVDHLLREIMAINSQVVNFEIPLAMQNHLRLRSRTIINNNRDESSNGFSGNCGNGDSSCGGSSTSSITGSGLTSSTLSSGFNNKGGDLSAVCYGGAGELECNNTKSCGAGKKMVGGGGGGGGGGGCGSHGSSSFYSKVTSSSSNDQASVSSDSFGSSSLGNIDFLRN